MIFYSRAFCYLFLFLYLFFCASVRSSSISIYVGYVVVDKRKINCNFRLTALAMKPFALCTDFFFFLVWEGAG